MGVNPNHASRRRQHRMIQPASGILETRLNIFGLKIGKFLDNLFGRQPVGQQIQHINHPNPHSANARPPAALLRINCYAIFHMRKLPRPVRNCTAEFPIHLDAFFIASLMSFSVKRSVSFAASWPFFP